MELLQAAGALPAAGVAAKGGGTIPLFADGSGGMIPLDAPAGGTVGDVLAMLAEALGRPVGALLYRTERLDNATLLADSGVGAEAVLSYSDAPVFRWGRHSADGVVSEDGLSWTKLESSCQYQEAVAISEDAIEPIPGARCRWRLLNTEGSCESAQVGVCVGDMTMDADFMTHELRDRVWYYFGSSICNGPQTVVDDVRELVAQGTSVVVEVCCRAEGRYTMTMRIADAEEQQMDPEELWSSAEVKIDCTKPLHLVVSNFKRGDTWKVIKYTR
eukprot:TRINITY_DN2009_c0_g1_i13.p1 TRINITY_DN2009_c0_g1~~TRINITY_DN2009_c0_g1_i13.p1  ORF type:complete len:293 (+),score=102.14 TRINITY_DN2009_c0_g1_i13:61-879(+)